MSTCHKCGTPLTLLGGEVQPCPKCAAAPDWSPLPRPLPVTPRGGGGALRWVVLGGLGILVFVVLLAESGAVVADTTDTKWKAEGKNESSWSGARGQAPLRGVGFAPSVTVSTPRGAGYDLATAAATALKKSAAGGGGPGHSKLEITITRVTPEGAPWVPFYKNGSCTFVATYTLTAETPWSSFAARGEVSGTVTQTMTGLCSAGLFREKMGEAIAAAIVSDLSKLVSKYS